MDGAIHSTLDGRIFIVLALMKPETVSEANWGHKSAEIIGLQTPDINGKFSVELLSKPDMTVPHWLPNLERPTGHNHVDAPGVMLQVRGVPIFFPTVFIGRKCNHSDGLFFYAFVRKISP